MFSSVTFVFIYYQTMPHPLGVDKEQSGLFHISSSPYYFCTFFENLITYQKHKHSDNDANTERQNLGGPKFADN